VVQYALVGVLVAIMVIVALLFLGPPVSQVFPPPCPTLDLSASAPTGLRLGVERVAATSCAPRVAVNGRAYFLSGGGWLDEDALVLREYGEINDSFVGFSINDPSVYAVEGVDPAVLLLYPVASSDNDSVESTFWVLQGQGMTLPKDACEFFLRPPRDCQKRPIEKAISAD
jgi:hypothetical protein